MLLRILLRRGGGLTLGLVTVLFVLHLELIKLLLLVALLAALTLTPALAAAPADFELARRQFQQGLIRLLFGLQRRRQRLRVRRRLLQFQQRLLHRGFRRRRRRLPTRIGVPRPHVAHLRQRVFLRLGYDRDIPGVLVGRGRAAGLALQFPGGVDDLLLQVRQFGGLTALLALPLLALTLLLAVLGFAFAKDLLKRPDLREKQIAHRPTHLPVGSEILRPDKIAHELIHLRFDVFQKQFFLHRFLLPGCGHQRGLLPGGAGKANLPAPAIGHPELESITDQPEIIRRLGAKRHLLQGRHPLIAARREPFQFRRLVRQRLEHKPRRQRVGASIGIHELQLVGSGLLQRKPRELRGCRISAGGQDEARPIPGQKAGGANRLVQLKREGNGRTLDRSHAPGVFNAFLGQRGVLRIADGGIGLFQPGMLEHLDVKLIRSATAVFHMITEIPGHFRDGSAEHRIMQRPLKRNVFRGAFLGMNNQHGFVGNRAAETRHHDERVALLKFHVSR